MSSMRKVVWGLMGQSKPDFDQKDPLILFQQKKKSLSGQSPPLL